MIKFIKKKEIEELKSSVAVINTKKDIKIEDSTSSHPFNDSKKVKRYTYTYSDNKTLTFEISEEDTIVQVTHSLLGYYTEFLNGHYCEDYKRVVKLILNKL